LALFLQELHIISVQMILCQVTYGIKKVTFVNKFLD
jgi:hypothetical protein